jgi:hypothetical protein
LDDIFFKSSVKRDFCTHEEQQYFPDMSFGRYTVTHRDSFFVALNGGGRAIGYLAGCLENPTILGHFNDITYLACDGERAADYLQHSHHLRCRPLAAMHRRNAALVQPRRNGP